MKTLFPLLAFVALFAGSATAADEGASSPWSRSDVASLRLIAGPTSPTGKQRIGIEISMKPGYKTYWRSPGDYGVPPVFDWTGSTNVGGLDVRWPLPERFADGAGSSIGYVDEVVIPVSVLPSDPSKPVQVALKFDYAVCDKICIPVKAEAQLWLEPGVTSVTSTRLEQFEKRVPVALKPDHGKDFPDITEAKVEDSGANQTLTFQIGLPNGSSVEDIFVEGPGMWTFGKPQFSPKPDGSLLARMKIKDRPKGASGPTPLIVTMRGLPRPIETRLELDIPAARP